jgi:hypothetical protein
MLNDVLRLLGDGGIHSTAELARRLGVSEELVAAMAGDLARHGYLAALDTGCSTACDGCGVAAACSVSRSDAPTLPLMALTAKGREAIRSAQA